MRIAGAVLVLLGFIALLGGIPYDHKETIAQVGGLKMQATEKRRLTVPPLVAGLAIVVGTALFIRGGRRPRA